MRYPSNRISRRHSLRVFGFFTVDLLNGTTAYVLVVIEHASRRIRSLGQAAPRKPLPGAVADLDAFRARRRDLIGGVIREYAQVA